MIVSAKVEIRLCLLLLFPAACGRIGYDPLSIEADSPAVAASGGPVAGADGSYASPDALVVESGLASQAEAALVDAGLDATVNPSDGAVIDAPQDGPVDKPPTVCSMTSNTTAQLTIVNNFPSTTVTPYWIDFSCAEVAYSDVGPLSSRVQPSYVTHPWRIRNSATHALIADVPALTGNTTVTVP